MQAAVVATLDTRPLLELAALLGPEDPPAVVLGHLARKAMHQAASSAATDIRIVGELPDTARASLAAWPVPVDEPEELDATVRRAGWISILGRGDDLASRCVVEAIRWDGGDWFPYSRAEDLDLHGSPWVQEWAKRLQPTPRTAAFKLIDRDDEGTPLVDPLTDAPVIRDRRGRLVATVPQRLPASAPLAELILDHHDMIWVRTADGTLWPAPCDAYWGISWGYSGSGPGTLTLLIQALLDDITAQAPDSNQGGSKHLERFFQQKLRPGTVLTRAQLQAVLAGRPIALEGGLEEDE
ncbi:hypothetical protein C8E86_7959 [Catellatospora citrea]|nr:hypothetical protein C8E86_7959 [Catellatospora citrea]